MTDIEPLTITEIGGEHTLMLSDTDFMSCVETFQEHDLEGNGYTWEGVARTLMADASGEDEIEYDSEAGTFVALSRDRRALELLGRALARLVGDSVALGRLLEDADPTMFDD